MLKAGKNLQSNYALDTDNWRAAAHFHPSAAAPLKLLEFLCGKQVHLELDANMYPQYGKHTWTVRAQKPVVPKTASKQPLKLTVICTSFTGPDAILSPQDSNFRNTPLALDLTHAQVLDLLTRTYPQIY